MSYILNLLKQLTGGSSVSVTLWDGKTWFPMFVKIANIIRRNK